MEVEVKTYCLGFLFDLQGASVALIQKRKPAWQLNRFNGIGGKVEDGETPYAAMCREFQEEAGLFVENWNEFCTLQGDGFCIHCFSAFSNDYDKVETTSNGNDDVLEPVLIASADCLPVSSIPNLRWLIPMALSMTRGEPCRHFTIIENNL